MQAGQTGQDTCRHLFEVRSDTGWLSGLPLIWMSLILFALVRSLSGRSSVCFGGGTGGCGSMSIVSFLRGKAVWVHSGIKNSVRIRKRCCMLTCVFLHVDTSFLACYTPNMQHALCTFLINASLFAPSKTVTPLAAHCAAAHCAHL